MATLFVLQGRDKGKRFDLGAGVLTLGRDHGNPIQVSDSEISRRHAEIRKDDEGYLLVDLTSSNGTFVNAEQITERRLVNGDRIQIGSSLLLFTDVDEQPLKPLEHVVDIVGTSNLEGSRIIKSLSQEAGKSLLSPEADASP